MLAFTFFKCNAFKFPTGHVGFIIFISFSLASTLQLAHIQTSEYKQINILATDTNTKKWWTDSQTG